MQQGRLIGALALAALAMPIDTAGAFDDSKYPNLKGQWNRVVVPGLGGQPSFDQTKPWGFGQGAPLTAEARTLLEASLADQAKGGQGNFIGHAQCLPGGMPFMMAIPVQEFVVTPETTYVIAGEEIRRIFTDGRDWPKPTDEVTATYQGYSIGQLDRRGRRRPL